jgi:hypothetical protein
MRQNGDTHIILCFIKHKIYTTFMGKKYNKHYISNSLQVDILMYNE